MYLTEEQYMHIVDEGQKPYQPNNKMSQDDVNECSTPSETF